MRIASFGFHRSTRSITRTLWPRLSPGPMPTTFSALGSVPSIPADREARRSRRLQIEKPRGSTGTVADAWTLPMLEVLCAFSSNGTAVVGRAIVAGLARVQWIWKARSLATPATGNASLDRSPDAYSEGLSLCLGAMHPRRKHQPKYSGSFAPPLIPSPANRFAAGRGDNATVFQADVRKRCGF